MTTTYNWLRDLEAEKWRGSPIPFSWNKYIKNPIKNTNGYLTTYKALYKFVALELHRNFSYAELSKVNRDGSLCDPVYISAVGSSWTDTTTELCRQISKHVYK